MKITPMLGMYVAMQHDTVNGGGWIAYGKTHALAIRNMLERMKYNTIKN